MISELRPALLLFALLCPAAAQDDPGNVRTAPGLPS